MGKQVKEGAKAPPDHTLASADIQADGAAPEVFAVTNLKAYVKPHMHEELSDSSGGAATTGTEMICRCVPVEQCVCDTVEYYHGGSPCPGHCACVGACGCDGHSCRYWHPY